MLGPAFPFAGGTITLGFASTSVGSCRLISVANPAEGFLVARFNAGMRQDVELTSLSNWLIEGVSDGAAPIELTEILVSVQYPEAVFIRYTGGGSVYRLTARNVFSQAGLGIDQAHDSIEFDLQYPSDPPNTVLLFDTVWGPLGLSKRNIGRRHIDKLVASRAISVALNTQLAQRLAATDGTSNRDGRPGSNRG